MPRTRKLSAVAFVIVAGIVLCAATWRTAAVSADSPAIVQVRKWQIDYTLAASERLSFPVQGTDAKGEMFHAPQWNISGSAILDMGVNDDGTPKMARPDALSGSWRAHTNSSGTFRGEYGFNPSPLKMGYAGGGSVSPADEQGNSVLLQIFTDMKTYEVDLSLRLEGYLMSDVSELVRQIDDLEAKAPAKDKQFAKAFMDMLRGLATGGGPAKASTPFKPTFNVSLDRLPLPDISNSSIPTLSGSEKVQVIFSEVSPGMANAVFSWTIKPYDDSGDVDVTVLSMKADHPHCVCGENKLVELSARATKSGGTWEPFEVNGEGVWPKLMKNQGGATPYFSMTGYDKTVGKMFVTAVYTWKGKQYRSKPFDVSFCLVEKPDFVDNPSLFDGQYHVFSQDAPGTVSVEARTHAWLNGKEIKDNSEGWQIDPDNLDFETEYTRGEIRAAFKAKGLPEKNTDFGKHQLTYTYEDGTCECESERREAQIFFPRDATNNPEGKLPNWAYYWKQTKAGLDAANFEVRSPIPASDVNIALPGLNCLGPVLTQSNENVIARYDPVKDVIYVAKDLPTLSCANRPSGSVEDKGIDCFAVTLRHEHQHQVELTTWWGPKFSRYSCIDDLDGDMVPNSVEVATPGCNSMLPWSCPSRPTYLKGTLFDTDLNAYQVGWRWAPHTADKEDWAYPGHQCGGR